MKWAISTIKSIAQVVGALMVIAGLLGGFFKLIDAKFPLVTRAEALEMQDIQQQTVQALGKIAGSVNKLANRMDRKDCEEFNEQYWRAFDALRRTPNDPIARDAKRAAQSKIEDTQGCVIDVRR